MAWNHNVIADMYGPHFLMVYFAVIVATLVWVGVVRRSLDPTVGERPPLIPSQPDALEIAYLRGGENEVARVVIFSLMEHGYLEIKLPTSRWNKEQRIGQSASPGDVSQLSPMERGVYFYFASPRTAREIYQSALPRSVKTGCGGYEQALRAERLLTNDEQAMGRLGWIGALVILGLGGYKLVAALTNGFDNVVFLILMALFSMPVLAFVARPRRLTQRGREYLRGVQQAFEGLKRAPTANQIGLVDPTILLVGIFGVTALMGTPQAAYATMFAQSSSGGGCGGGGGGCGGGGCGGGGCGGCGGCGGGG